MPFSNIEIAIGGYIKTDGTVVVNEAPNTFLSPGINVFDRVRFDVTDAAKVIILARVRDSAGGAYQPSSSIFNWSLFKANVTYTNGNINVNSIPAVSPGVVYEQSEEDDGGNTYTLYPAKLEIPLSGIINYITVNYDIDLSHTFTVINSPESIDQFGFMALNRNNPSYQMQQSKVARNFGLVLDAFGAWDILVSPEAILSRQDDGGINFGGSRFSRSIINTDDRFIIGIGVPDINEDNDVIGFDQSSIPSAVRQYITAFPLPGYASIWAIRIQPQVKAYMSALRRQSGGQTLDGCFIDIPIYARASTSLAEGSANIRIFADVKCIFDYDMCEFYWNLGTPVEPEAFAGVSGSVKIDFEELVDCSPFSQIVNEGGQRLVDISNTFIVKLNDIPVLNNGNSLLLLKRDASQTEVISVDPATPQRVNTATRITGINPDKPWEFNCITLSPVEVQKANQSILYYDPSDLSVFTNIFEDIVAITSDPNSKWMFVQPRFGFPNVDEFGNSFPSEEIIAGIGFQFKDWDQRVTKTKNEFIVLTAIFRMPIEAQNINLQIPMRIRYLYNEDRRVINGGMI